MAEIPEQVEKDLECPRPERSLGMDEMDEFYVYAYIPSAYRSRAVPRDKLRPWAPTSKRHFERYGFLGSHRSKGSEVRRRVAEDLNIAPYEVVFLNTNEKSGLLITDKDAICNIPPNPPGRRDSDEKEKGQKLVILGLDSPDGRPEAASARWPVAESAHMPMTELQEDGVDLLSDTSGTLATSASLQRGDGNVGARVTAQEDMMLVPVLLGRKRRTLFGLTEGGQPGRSRSRAMKEVARPMSAKSKCVLCVR